MSSSPSVIRSRPLQVMSTVGPGHCALCRQWVTYHCALCRQWVTYHCTLCRPWVPATARYVDSGSPTTARYVRQWVTYHCTLCRQWVTYHCTLCRQWVTYHCTLCPTVGHLPLHVMSTVGPGHCALCRQWVTYHCTLCPTVGHLPLCVMSDSGSPTTAHYVDSGSPTTACYVDSGSPTTARYVDSGSRPQRVMSTVGPGHYALCRPQILAAACYVDSGSRPLRVMSTVCHQPLRVMSTVGHLPLHVMSTVGHLPLRVYVRQWVTYHCALCRPWVPATARYVDSGSPTTARYVRQWVTYHCTLCPTVGHLPLRVMSTVGPGHCTFHQQQDPVTAHYVNRSQPLHITSTTSLDNWSSLEVRQVHARRRWARTLHAGSDRALHLSGDGALDTCVCVVLIAPLPDIKRGHLGVFARAEPGAAVAERLACSPPTKANRVQSLAGLLRLFVYKNRAGRCRWSSDSLGGDLPFPPPPHSSASPSSALKTRPFRSLTPRPAMEMSRHASGAKWSAHSKSESARISLINIVLGLITLFMRRSNETVNLDPRPGRRVFARGNRAGRCRWSARFLADIPFPPAPSFRRVLHTHLNRPHPPEELAVKSRPNLFTHSHSNKSAYFYSSMH
ncbi:hypothetical protein PR048_029618 [Dryococelus australis]|uniref:Uncharacterized protein n=1 Tax=Dryococelus australis TaxID=614101 RepID=A0ABQ9GDW2_9NEOP|nr:hypothetical protein PR048_029618 [Dryococelus australis]